MEYDLKLSQQDVQIIVGALGELPLKISAIAYANVQRQIIEQDGKNAIPLNNLEEKSDA